MALQAVRDYIVGDLADNPSTANVVQYYVEF